ncbi:Zn-ribbon domain-containing OB-fold protein [Acidocella sp.]|uniref:Zn-ribbon domain-containing OB-fold protein n=1 Tax=Acidocella sp. TaxID=50710 RepID=UPI003D0443AA
MHFETLDVPGPTYTPVTAHFWEAIAQGRFELQLCQGCGHRIFYPRAICPHCWSEDLAWEPAQPTGELETFSIVHRPGHPAWEGIAPYVVGIISLTDGPHMLSHILFKSVNEARVGIALKMQPTLIGKTVLPCFVPIE